MSQWFLRYCHTRLHLDSQLSWESGKFQLARWSHEVVLFSVWTDPTTQSSLRTCFFFQCCAVSPPHLFPTSTKYVRCPPLLTPIVFPIKKVCAVSPPQCSPVPLPHSALSWILSRNIWTHFHVRCPHPNVVLCLCLSTLILGLSWNINLAPLLSSRVALPAQLVFLSYWGGWGG